MILDIQFRPVKFKVVTRIRKISRKLSLPCKRCKQLQSLKVLFSSSRSEVMNIYSVNINYFHQCFGFFWHFLAFRPKRTASMHLKYPEMRFLRCPETLSKFIPRNWFITLVGLLLRIATLSYILLLNPFLYLLISIFILLLIWSFLTSEELNLFMLSLLLTLLPWMVLTDFQVLSMLLLTILLSLFTSRISLRIFFFFQIFCLVF